MKIQLQLSKYFTFGILCIFLACGSERNSQEVKLNVHHLIKANDELLDIAMVDGFSPPVASRVYVYPHIAHHIALSAFYPNELHSLIGTLNELDSVKTPEPTGAHPELSALLSFCKMGKKVVFSEYRMDQLADYYKDVARQLKLDEKVIKKSEVFAEELVNGLSDWVNSDHYIHTRTLDRFTSTKRPGKWVETPPDYLSGLEPHWNKIRPMIIDTQDNYLDIYPPEFDRSTQSAFYKMVKQVYDQSQNLDSAMIKTALYWDDNPNITEHRGHLVTMVHKISPPGHWLNIISQIVGKENTNYVESAGIYTYCAIAMFDAIISCWDVKYKTNLVRPITYIQENIDVKWRPLIQTPPFPEFTSGHSVISASAATVLDHFFGDNYSFIDSTEVIFGLEARSFDSFQQAAWEVSLSRFYAGIHYWQGIEEGNKQGKLIGKRVLELLK